MDWMLHRYKNVTVLLVVVAAQLLLLAYQVKSNQDMRLIRLWSVTAVTPVARVIETVRGGTVGFVRDYFLLLSAREENARLHREMARIKLENQFLKTELSTADRARVLAAFQARTPSKTLAARIIANATGANSKVVFVDRGSTAGILPGMAVITPDGIVGKVISVYPTASQVMLLYDPSFAAGVISEKHRVQGTLKGQGHGTLLIDHVPSEMKVEVGERFFTSGDDRIFPKGLPVGEVKVVRPGRTFKEIMLVPSGFLRGLEEVLIVQEGIHQVLPGSAAEQLPYHVLPAPEQTAPSTASPEGTGDPDGATTEAGNAVDAPRTETDRLRARYRKLGETQGVRFGQGGRIPNFNAAEAAPQAQGAASSSSPSSSSTPPAAATAPPAAASTTPPATPPQP